MASEATISCSLSVRKDNLMYQSPGQTGTLDVTGTKGPVPGAITVALAGTDIDLSQLTTPGVCWMINVDQTNFVEIGIKEPATGFFYPFLELLPGIPALVVLSRNLLEEYTGTGTGTSAPTNKLHAKANGAPCVVRIEAFEK